MTLKANRDYRNRDKTTAPALGAPELTETDASIRIKYHPASTPSSRKVSMQLSEIELDVDRGVATIRLNAPERRNALTPEMARLLVNVCDEIDADQTIGAVVVRGEGAHFCSGAHRRQLDLAGEDPTDPVSYDDFGVTYQSFVRLGQLKVPSIAAVQGSVVGAGLNLMLAADLRIVATDARILSGFFRIGIHPGGGHFALMNRAAGREATAAMGVFAEEIDGTRAAEIGMAWEALDSDDVVDRARQIAARPGSDPELARATVASFRMLAGPPAMSWDAAVAAERATQMWSLRRRALHNEKVGSHA